MGKTKINQKKAAKKFIETWNGHGYEKGETQKFWIDLLTSVFGIENISQFILFEERVKDKIKNRTITNFIDAYIPETQVMIEQKSSSKDLVEPVKQSDGTLLTPFQQAKKYVADLPLSLHPKWIVTCNFDEFLVYDMENPSGDPQQIFLKDLENDFYRLEFLVNGRNEKIKREEEVSLKAGELVGKLYDALFKEYINPDENSFRSLNILCVRIVFCLYAEDAGLFETRTAFEDYIKSFSLENMRRGLMDLFKILNTKPENRDKYDTKINSFPYVNGGLFAAEDIEIPNFTKEIVDVLVDHCAPFDWSEISPTIFGAVFESTLNPQTRRKGGMHYTSVENIHKVIDPLFLDDLRAEFSQIVEPFPETAHKPQNTIFAKETFRETSLRKRKKLEQFQNKIASLTFLDPACGSGNFLTETYISLRRLENEILKIIHGTQQFVGRGASPIKVKISQFYGIEINDFAVTVAKTALWIAESQMMKETEEIVDEDLDFLPLSTSATIVEGNALRMDWSTLEEEKNENFVYTDKLNLYRVDEKAVETAGEPEIPYGAHFKELNVAAKEVTEKIFPAKDGNKPVIYDYIIGNPPFSGYGKQTESNKLDTLHTYVDENRKPYRNAGKIDYVANWYFKATKLIQGKKTRCAFVSTNSITQGEQVASVWKPLFERYGLQIDFAFRSFKWYSESTDMAHVHCVIIGFSCRGGSVEKQYWQTSCAPRIFNADGTVVEAKNINPYLMDAESVWIINRSKPVCDVPLMTTGNRPADGGHLIIEADEYEDFIKKEPAARKWIKNLTGSEEYINGRKRYCLWLVGATPAEVKGMKEVYKRVMLCREDRLNGAEDRQKLADTPALFREINNPEQYLLIPRVSSERRKYIPIGFLNSNTIPTDSATIITHAGLYEFGILTSSVHNAWMRAVCGRLESRYRYSKDIVYNNFPWCNPTEAQKAKIEKTAQTILDARAKYPDSSLADLYDETTMPPELRKAHKENDKAVMAAYGFDPKMSEAEIVAKLFRMYKKLTEKK